MKSKPMIAKKPFKILEIPGLEDNYYYNLVDCYQNDISIVLANTLYMWINDKVNKIYDAYDCEEISSIK